MNELLNTNSYPSNRFFPAGMIMPYAGVGNAPEGWHDCDGSALSRSEYEDLFNAIGTTYGSGDGSTTFNLPNYNDRFLQGNATPGTVKAAGLPNITGSFTNIKTAVGSNNNDNASNVSGAFTKAVVSTGGGYSSSTIKANVNFNFDASKSNAIYGKSNTVQPPAVTVRYLIKL